MGEPEIHAILDKNPNKWFGVTKLAMELGTTNYGNVSRVCRRLRETEMIDWKCDIDPTRKKGKKIFMYRRKK